MTYSANRPNIGYAGLLLLPSSSGMGWITQAATQITALTANQGYYMPFMAPYDTAVATMAFYDSTGTNNHDLGIYDSSFNRLTSRGSTASTAGAVNTWTLGTPQLIAANTLYYAAYSTAGTATVLAITGSNVKNNGLGLLTQAIGAVALPNPATPAVPAANHFPILALTFTT